MNNFTIALNMIVGSGDGQLLERCLNAFKAKDIFDEIVIVLTSDDVGAEKVAHKFTKATNIYKYPWVSARYPFGSFAGARNLALQNTTSDYVMWLDCDDLPCIDFAETFITIQQVLDKYDIFMIDYRLSEQSSLATKRERVWRRIPTLFWYRAAHEELTIDFSVHTHAYIGNLQVIHAPEKSLQVSADRNFNIIQHEYTVSADSVNAFYYGRELILKDDEAGAALLQNLLDERKLNHDVLAQICILLCDFYRKHDLPDRVITYCRVGISLNENYADFYINLAHCYECLGEIDKAISFYKQALSCKFTGGGVFNISLYTFTPAMALVLIYTKRDEIEEALLMSKITLRHASHDQRQNVIDMRKELAQRILSNG